MTLGTQIRKMRERFGLQRVVMVGDRGMITQARIDQELKPVEGLGWISTLKSSQIAALIEEGTLEQSLFDQKNLAEITSPDYPGERLIACRNPFLAQQRRTRREELLKATEIELQKIVLATQRQRAPLRSKTKIALRVGRKIDARNVAKHFILEIEEDRFQFRRNQEKIDQEAAMDGLYVVRTSVSSDTLSVQAVVERYKDLGAVEQAFRCMKTVDLKIRPIYHYLEHRVRGHVFLCLLAYYVEWHMRKALAPMLFAQEQSERLPRQDVVSPKVPDSIAAKKATDGTPVHSFQTLLSELATLARNTIQPNLADAPCWQQDTEPTALQQKAFSLLRSIAIA
jgi:transposase